MLIDFSNQLADVVDAVAPSVVQVQAHHRAASGIVFGKDAVLTTGRVVGREERPIVRAHDSRELTAQLTGWDPATRLALLEVPGLDGRPFTPGHAARVGSIALALARSWSNAITASAGLVSIVGGPLRTAPRRSIERVIRTSAPMHEGFAGGALVGADGGFLGIVTGAEIRGLRVVIPADIAFQSAGGMLERRSLKRGYLGIAAQPISVPERQRPAGSKPDALLVVGVKDGSPAAAGGVLVGDLLTALDGTALETPEDLLDLLVGDRVGRALTLRVLRGGSPVELTVTAAERG